MLSAQSQCLLRQEELYQQGHWLFVNATDTEVFSHLPDSVVGFHQYYDTFLKAQQSSSNKQVFGATFPDSEIPTNKFDGIMLYLPKAKKQTVWLLKHLASLVKTGGFLCLVGENKGGIKSSGKLLDAVGINTNKVEAAKHCSVYATTVESTKPFALDSQISWFSTSVNQQQLELASLPGVFSHGELDAGTQLLLEHVKTVPNGKILDFACGNGVIAQYLTKLNPQIELTLSDTNSLALHCAKNSLDKIHKDAEIVASDGLAEVNGQFNAIYTNPPFHSGLATDYNITQKFIADAANKVLAGGELWLVANRFLPYPEHLQRHFGGFKRIAETSKFVLFQCRK